MYAPAKVTVITQIKLVNIKMPILAHLAQAYISLIEHLATAYHFAPMAPTLIALPNIAKQSVQALTMQILSSVSVCLPVHPTFLLILKLPTIISVCNTARPLTLLKIPLSHANWDAQVS